MSRREQLSAAIDALADRYPGGHLRASTDAAGLLRDVVADLDRLRAIAEAADAVAYAEGLPDLDAAMTRLRTLLDEGEGSGT